MRRPHQKEAIGGKGTRARPHAAGGVQQAGPFCAAEEAVLFGGQRAHRRARVNKPAASSTYSAAHRDPTHPPTVALSSHLALAIRAPALRHPPARALVAKLTPRFHLRLDSSALLLLLWQNNHHHTCFAIGLFAVVQLSGPCNDTRMLNIRVSKAALARAAAASHFR